MRMKRPPPLHSLVSKINVWPLLIVLAGWSTGAAVLASIAMSEHDDRMRERYGAALAEQVAALSAHALIRSDRITLAALVTRNSMIGTDRDLGG